ncbi:MAG: hypothetical protein HFH09_01745 [Bacilli bacterium]|jgi:hypothetical protein|nr:hypothetical protein [Bacilli bacterium]
MDKRLIAKIFIVVSILFIATLCGIYGYRFIHYYRLENPKIAKERLLWTTITDLNHVVSSGNGLYKDNKEYYYKGAVEDNYVFYSGILWRIVKVDQNNNVILISEDALTSMVLGYEADNFKKSYGYDWLNNTFYNQLSNQELLVEHSYCADAILDSNDVRCTKEETGKITMMSVYEYLKASGSKSYLNNGKTFWTVSPNEEYKTWFVNQSGLVSNESVSGESYYSYGIRPVIAVKGDTKILAGSGTKDSPYQITIIKSSALKEQFIGSYVSYSNQIWRIIEINDLGVKIALNGYLKVNDEEISEPFSKDSNLYSIKSTDNIGYYLNSKYYDSLENKEYLVEYPWRNYYYNSVEKYNYHGKAADVVRTEVGLLQVSDLFINNFSDYALMNPANEDDGTVFTVLKDGRLFANSVTENLKVRPVVVLKINLTISGGSGTESDPFEIGV